MTIFNISGIIQSEQKNIPVEKRKR